MVVTHNGSFCRLLPELMHGGEIVERFAKEVSYVTPVPIAWASFENPALIFPARASGCALSPQHRFAEAISSRALTLVCTATSEPMRHRPLLIAIRVMMTLTPSPRPPP